MVKLIFFGTPEFALPILRKINNSKHEILAVYTRSQKIFTRSEINKSVIHEYLKNSFKCRILRGFRKEENFLKKLILIWG